MSLDLRAILVRARGVIAVIAPITPIQSDDALVVVIDAALADAEMFGWLKSKVASDQAGTLSLESDASAAMQFVLERHGITWQQLLAALPAIFEIVRVFVRG